MSDQMIRDAVAELVAAAPPPKPLPRVSTANTPTDRSYRWLAVAAAAVLLIGGVVAVGAWRSTRDTAPGTDMLPPVPTTIAPAVEPPTTSPVTPPGTLPTTTESAPPAITSPGAVNTLTFEVATVPDGTLAFGPDDVVATRVDGDLWWYPGLLGDTPGEPVRLLDMGDPREPVTEGEGPSTISFIAGAVNDTLVFGTCCEPVVGDVLLLSELGGELYANPYVAGWNAAISPDGTRLVSVGYGFIVVDLAAGNGSALVDPTAPFYTKVAWAPDGSMFALLGYGPEGEWFLETRLAEPPFEVMARTTLELDAQPADTDAWIISWGERGTTNFDLQIATRTGDVVEQHSYDARLDRLAAGFGPLPEGTTSVHADATGRRLVVAEGRLLVDDGGTRELATGIVDAWFVPIHTTAAIAPSSTDAPLDRYFSALAAGRFDDAATLLGAGPLDHEQRRDLRPLVREFGDVDDLAARLQAWCETVAVCTEPTTITQDGGIVAATFRTGEGFATGYFRFDSSGGAPAVSGLPPRRPLPGSQPCPVTGVLTATEADLDGVGGPETIVVTVDSERQGFVHVCNTSDIVNSWAYGLVGDSVVLAVVDDGGDGRDELLIGESGPDAVSQALVERRGIELVPTGAEFRLTYPPLPTGTPNVWWSFGCAEVDGTRRLVEYRYELVGGATPDTATSAIVTTVLEPFGADVGQRTYALPSELDAVTDIVDPHCNGLPILTVG